MASARMDKVAIAKAAAALETTRKKRAETQKPPEEADIALQQPLTTSSGRRLALARWIADERNPLTARIAVN